MSLLISGLLLFAAVHLVPSLAPEVKSGWRNKLGEGGYKGTFSLLLLLSFTLIILGWRSVQPELIYLPSPSLKHPAMGLVALAFFLFVISNRPSRVRQWIRHPQLSGVALWSCAHLLLNGDNRSLLLFAGMGVWAIVEIVAINKRDGERPKLEAPGVMTDLVSVVITVVVIGVVIAIHPYITGMPVL